MDYYRLTIKFPKQPWRWLRFRLLTILLLTTIVALVFAWRKDHLAQVAKQDQLQQTISQMRNPGPHWDTDEVTGPPNTSQFGDRNTAWASKSQDGQQEWLILEYDRPISATSVQIHENYKPGAVSKITHVPSDGGESILWEGTDPTPQSALGGVSSIPISPQGPIQRIKVYIDSHLVPGWNEVDAVGLIDDSNNVFWAKKAWASSCYGRNNVLSDTVTEDFFRFGRYRTGYW